MLGGGPAAMTAAFELTATPQLRDRYEVTVYQTGWRLGGKCATGRNIEHHSRIEEHGLHVWFGFYDNSFRLLRATYEELEARGHPPAIAFAEAFEPCDELVLYDRQGDGWQAFPFTWPCNDQVPGGDYPLPDVWEIAERVCAWAVFQWESLWSDPRRQSRVRQSHRPPSPRWILDLARGVGVGAGIDAQHGGEELLYLSRHLAQAGRLLSRAPTVPAPVPGLARIQRTAQSTALRLLGALLGRFRDWAWEHVVRERCEQDARLRLVFTTLDVIASATAGVAADGVLEHGWEVINDRDLCRWLEEHGARQVTLGRTPAQRSPLLRALYDVAFAYPDGVIDHADAAAGTALNDLLRLAFSYRGALFYKMKAGMAETVLTPMYELLRCRGVEFKFFHAVTELRLSADGRLIEEIDVVPQVELANADYDPLVPVKKLKCWPSEPTWSRLRDGERLKQRGIDFELHANPLGRRPTTLVRDEDFDAVVLGIPVGALRPICSHIAKRHEPFARMLDSAVTVRTQAFQLWLSRSTRALGWPHGTRSVIGSYVEPLDTWCDMTHLLGRERWPRSERPKAIAYFCGVLDDREHEDHAAATARVKDNARAFVEKDLQTLFPRTRKSGSTGIEWNVLCAADSAKGTGRLAAQYWRANTTGSERYVLTPAKGVAHRLGADQSGVDNLVLAGDWTRNGIDGGCVEAAVTSGMQAARALIGHDRRLPGESPTWLTDRSVKRSGHAAAPGNAHTS